MNLIDRIENEAELNSVRDHIAAVLADKMSLPLGQCKANERIAWMLGARDWNTALGMVRTKQPMNPDMNRVSGVSDRPRSDNEVITDNIVNFLLNLSGDPSVKTLAAHQFCSAIYRVLLKDMLIACDIRLPSLENSSPDSVTARNLWAVVHALVESGRVGVYQLNRYFLEMFGLPYHHLASAGKCCIKCESSLDVLGYCEDETCPYHDYGQYVEGFYQGMTNGPVRKRASAWMETDDGVFKVGFDPLPYFMHKLVKGEMAQTIHNLNAIQWMTDYAADEVAEFFGESDGFSRYPDYRDLEKAFNRVSAHPNEFSSDGDLSGFEVYIQQGDVRNWLSDHQPKLAELIVD